MVISRKELGSLTAKGGFANEFEICKKFNNWKKDEEAKSWLKIMSYNIIEIKKLEAIQIPSRIPKNKLTLLNITEEEYNNFIKFKKADAQIRIVIKIGTL